MKIELGFGKGVQEVWVAEENLQDILLPNEAAFPLTGEDEVRRALREPIGSPPLREIIKPGEKIVIITSDITRPMPTAAVMPALMEELDAAGIADEDVTLVFGLGSHRPQTREEKRRLAGDAAYARYACVDSDPEDCLRLGMTSRGTPVDITRVVAQADRRICLGNVEYHYFAGYSGGAKALMPGVSSRASIQRNHSHMVEPGANAGQLEGNPIREDIEEAARMCRCDFILNVVLDEHKRIVKAVAGDCIQAHREGCKAVDALYLKPLDHRADIVLVSQGGAPKDMNLYQTQKALDNAKHAVRKGGVVILVGSCKEGMGEETFALWMTRLKPKEMVACIRKDFQLGGHKAAAIALVLEDAQIYLVSEMGEELVGQTCLRPFLSAQEALDAAMEKLGAQAKVLVMPYGGSTLPREA